MKRLIYYILQFTWNLLTNILGLITFLVLVLTRHEVKMFGPNIVTIVGKSWGGLSLGIFIFTGENSKNNFRLLAHEFGHSLQGLILGPLWLFLVGIPSSIRYNYRNIVSNKKQLPPYDSIWFEGTATKYGLKYAQVDWLNKGV